MCKDGVRFYNLCVSGVVVSMSGKKRGNCTALHRPPKVSCTHRLLFFSLFFQVTADCFNTNNPTAKEVPTAANRELPFCEWYNKDTCCEVGVGVGAMTPHVVRHSVC